MYVTTLVSKLYLFLFKRNSLSNNKNKCHNLLRASLLTTETHKQPVITFGPEFVTQTRTELFHPNSFSEEMQCYTPPRIIS